MNPSEDTPSSHNPEPSHSPSQPVPVPAPVRVREESLSKTTGSVPFPAVESTPAASGFVIPQAPSPAASAASHIPVVPVNAIQDLPAPQHQLHYQELKKPGLFKEYWRKAGGGSFTVSLLIHAGLLIGAYFVVETVVTEKKVDFLPGGGSAGAEAAQQQLTQTVNVKRQQVLKQSQPMKRLVTENASAAITLPDVPVDTVDVPVMASLMGGGAMSSGGFGGSGAGGGLGSGVGTGSMKGFLARTVFGNLGGNTGVPGVLYDFKQDKKSKPLEYNANGYFQLVKEFTDSKFADSKMREYYQAPQKMSFTFLAVPLMRAEEGPKAFAVQDHVQPRGWLVHYTGTITPPETGEWRFVGYFDDLLAVYIDNKPVLDASRDDLVNLGEKNPDQEVRQSFGNMNVLNGKCYAGKWFRLSGPAKIDILVGERPGGQVGGLLMVENKKTKYKKRDNDTPILPLFVTSPPDMEDLARMKEFNEANKAFGIRLDDIPVFRTDMKPSLDGGRMTAPATRSLPPRQ